LTEQKQGASQATSYRGPWNLVYYEAYVEEADSTGRERYLKVAAAESFYDGNFAITLPSTFFEPREAKPFTAEEVSGLKRSFVI
jgi:hypothetical protein